MQAERFYQTRCDNAIPLYLISESQWAEGVEPLSLVEKNSLAVRQFKGKLGEFCLVSNANGQLSKVFIGAGDGRQKTALASVVLQLPPGSYELQDILTHTAAIHWGLAQYRFDRYKKQDTEPRRLVVSEADSDGIFAKVQAIFLVRDLINTPASDMGPKQLAEACETLAKTFGAQFKQWVGSELLKDNFPAIHAVGRASAHEPRLLSLTWGNTDHPKVTLIGKGVCFDSGGLDIKPSSNMRLMKKDMGGAAHVLGLAHWVMATGLPIHLNVLIPAVENAIGPDAFRPGDILTMRNGMTVEIDNTDAEGRLVLADAIVKALESKPDLIIDYATLTGAARVALGTDVAVMFSNHDGVAAELLDASQKTNDPMWRLPLHEGYNELLNSNIADMVNSSPSPYGGAITAALFLQRFVDKNMPWVHFDVMAWNVAAKPGRPEGGEAMGFRAVIEYLSRIYG